MGGAESGNTSRATWCARCLSCFPKRAWVACSGREGRGAYAKGGAAVGWRGHAVVDPVDKIGAADASDDADGLAADCTEVAEVESGGGGLERVALQRTAPGRSRANIPSTACASGQGSCTSACSRSSASAAPARGAGAHIGDVVLWIKFGSRGQELHIKGLVWRGVHMHTCNRSIWCGCGGTCGATPRRRRAGRAASRAPAPTMPAALRRLLLLLLRCQADRATSAAAADPGWT